MEWSPRGSVIGTLHRQGVALWGGASFERILRVSHPGVQSLLFSPCERFILTFSEYPDNRGRPLVSLASGVEGAPRCSCLLQRPAGDCCWLCRAAWMPGWLAG